MTTNESLGEMWTKAKDLIKPQTTTITFETWIQPLELKSYRDNNIILIASNQFQKDTIEANYIDTITQAFNFITNKNCQVYIKLVSEYDGKFESENKKSGNFFVSSGLNPKYTFETFVVGNNSNFAHAAALGVTEQPGSKYNPLFLYGGVGLGKTHLMHAIGNKILVDNPNSKVLYVTSENFTNQLINALKDQATESFREKYRNIDVLLIDDIQFIANKKSTQEEFFHTFNTLYESNKQIVLSSDKPPKDIELLEDRLKSRFECGLIADISKPDYETRLAILRKKTQIDNIIIDDNILSEIATKISTNIRELEGTLNKLIAKASLMNSPVTMEMAQTAIDTIVKSQEKVISSKYVQETVAKYFNISVQDLVGQKRSANVTFPRQIAMYLCRNIVQMSLPQIGVDFGSRDHSTVMHACNKIEKDIESNSNTKLIVESVERIILDNN